MDRRGPATELTTVVDAGTADRGSALVVGGGHVGRTVASHLSDAYDVTFVSRERGAFERAGSEDISAIHADALDARTLDEAVAADASLAVVVTSDAAVTLLVAQLLRTRFDVERVVVRVDDSERRESFDALDVETVCVPDLLADEVTARVESLADDVAET